MKVQIKEIKTYPTSYFELTYADKIKRIYNAQHAYSRAVYLRKHG